VLLALLSVFGSSVLVLIVVIAALGWDRYATVIRPLAMRMRRQEFTLAAEVVGASKARILFGELLPNVVDQILVIMTVEMGLVIIIEAAISFLGLGLPPPTPSLGLMIAEGRDYMFFLPYLMVIPGVVIFIAQIAIYLLGDGIGDLFAPDDRVNR
jgi:peptide/nickel transport system permease protein